MNTHVARLERMRIHCERKRLPLSAKAIILSLSKDCTRHANPFTLSLSKGRAVLRQAQDEQS